MASLPRRPLLLAASAALACAAALAPRAALALDHCGQVTTNQVWSSADNPHDICSQDVSIRGSTLRILPGAIVRFQEGADLIVESGAGLVAVGDTVNAPIRFIAVPRTPTAGYWGQIRFDSGAVTSTIEAAFISHGGRDGKAMVEVRSPAAELFNVAFIQSAAAPLLFSAEALGPSTFRAGSNTVREQRCSLIRFSPVGQYAIEVDATAEIDVPVDASWANFCVPYLVRGTVTIAGPPEIQPTLTLSPGTQLKFDADGGIVTGLSAAMPGHLESSGQPDVLEHVVITGQVEEPGSWGGILFTEFSTISNSLINTDVKYGGRGGVPMIRVRDTTTYALDLTMRFAKAYPLELPSTAVDSFLGSMVKHVAPPIKDNGIDRVLVRAKDIAVDVPRSAIWGDIEAPYEIDGDILVASDQGKEGPAASFRLLPGTHLLFADGAALRIGDPAGPRARFAAGPVPAEPDASRAALAASPADAVLPADDAAASQGGETVLGALSGGRGAWKGIIVADTAVEAQLEGVRIENGGQDGPMVQWGTVRGAITKCTFSGAAGYPISLPLSHIDVIAGADQQAAVNRNRFEGNGVDRVLVRTTSELTQRQITMASPGAGIEFDGDVLFAGVVTPLVDMDAGLDFYLRPGKVFKLGDGGIRATVRLNDARGDDRISFLPAEPGQPHGGVLIGAGSSLRDAEDSTVAVEVLGAGASAGAAFVTVDGGLEVAGLTVTGDAQSANATGMLVRDGGEATVMGPRLSKLATGVKVEVGGRLVLRNGWITECSQWGVLNEDATRCPKASLIWWGDEKGPLDPSDAKDDCMNIANESTGSKVSDHVDWEGFAIDTDLTPFGGVSGKKRAYLPVGWTGLR